MEMGNPRSWGANLGQSSEVVKYEGEEDSQVGDSSHTESWSTATEESSETGRGEY
jgi:hypothetical protein